MKLPSFKRLNKSDYEEKDQSLVETLANSLNGGIDSLYGAFSNNVSIKDNFYASVVTVQLTTDANGIPVAPTSFTVDSFLRSFLGLQVINAQNLTNTAGYPTGGIWMAVTKTQTGFSVNKVTGLIPNNLYQLTVVVYG
jgi:hypothetical protein